LKRARDSMDHVNAAIVDLMNQSWARS
jgi:hypothetical protein